LDEKELANPQIPGLVSEGEQEFNLRRVERCVNRESNIDALATVIKDGATVPEV
jgi:hypothetical protein